MTNDFFADFLDDYFAESEEHLMALRRNLLALEPFVEQPQVEQSLLDELLRSFHSLKGISGMVGFKDAEQLAHQMESYLRALREGRILTAEGMDTLMSSTKILEQVITSHRTSAPLPDIAPAIANLNALSPEETPTVSAIAFTNGMEPKPVEEEEDTEQTEDTEDTTANLFQPPIDDPAPAPTAVSLTLKPEESARLAVAFKRGEKAWHFEFVPDQALAQRGINVNYIRDRLQAIGELIHASPRVTPKGGIVFDFVVASRVDETRFKDWSNDGLAYAAYSQNARAAQQRPEEEVKREASEKPAASAKPIATVPSNVVRVDLARLDELMRLVGELAISRARLEENIKNLDGSLSAPQLRPLRETTHTLQRQMRDLREGVMRVRLVPINETFARMQFVVRDLAREMKKQVVLELSGQDTEIDKFIVERITDPLLHLVRNAISHGLETENERIAQGKPPQGKLALRAWTAGEMVAIEIQDDGRGVDVERVAHRARALGLIGGDGKLDAATLLDLICAPSFSTREQVDLTSGRGVGMAVVKNTVQELGGLLAMDTQPGQGTRFRIQLPLTLTIADALIVSVGGQTYAMPQSSVVEAIEFQAAAVKRLENNEILLYRGSALPLLRLSDLFKLPDTSQDSFHAFVIGNGLNTVGIVVDRILGQREIVVRPLSDPLVQTLGISGATELGDGRVVLILDAAALLKVGRLDP